MVELRPQKSVLVLRVGRFGLPTERGELCAPSLPHGLHQPRVAMADKILKRRLFAVFLAHEEQGNKRGEQDCAGGEFQLLEADEPREPLAEHAIAYVIVILGKDDESFRRDFPGRSSVPAPAMF